MSDGRSRLLSRLEKTWVELKASYAGLADTRMVEPGVVGDWSVKDLLAHVTTWEEETLKHLPLIVRGGVPLRYSQTHGGVDAFNAEMTERKRGLTLSEVLGRLDETHRRLIAYVESTPDEHLTGETRFRRRLRLDTYGHYPEHANAIREWRVRVESL